MSSQDMSSFVSITDIPDDVGFSTFFWHIFSKHKYTDVEFDLLGPDGPITFTAHKIVLSLWSPHFADKFYSEGMKTDTVLLNDVNPEAFEAMLKFMYGYIPELESNKKACELYKVAVKFQVTSLMKSCRQILSEMVVVPSNVFDVLEASEYMQNKSLTDRCLKLIQERTEDVMEAYDLSAISSSMLNTFVDLPKMSLPGEFELLMWVFAWGKTKYLEDSKYSSTREALEEFLPKMQFLSLSNVEFALLYKHQEAFFNKDEVVSIFMNIGIRGSKPLPTWYDENRPVRVFTRSRE